MSDRYINERIIGWGIGHAYAKEELLETSITPELLEKSVVPVAKMLAIYVIEDRNPFTPSSDDVQRIVSVVYPLLANGLSVEEIIWRIIKYE